MKIDGSIDFNLLTSEKAINNHSKLSDNRKKLSAMNGNSIIDNMTSRYAETPSLLVTNYDEIIGDFGKELEQEIGLIMAEYSFMNEANMSPDELMRLKKMRVHKSQNVSTTTNSTSAIILAQDVSCNNNFPLTDDSPSSNELATDHSSAHINSPSSITCHYAPARAARFMQRMRSASACDVRRKELYQRQNERRMVSSFVNKEATEAWMSCVNTDSNKSNQNNLIDSNQRYYESIMDHDNNKQHNQVWVGNFLLFFALFFPLVVICDMFNHSTCHFIDFQ